MDVMRNSIASTPVVKLASVARMASGPTTGSTGMLWYTCSAMITPLGCDETNPPKGERHRIGAGPDHH
jgi:hypothetical protein